MSPILLTVLLAAFAQDPRPDAAAARRRGPAGGAREGRGRQGQGQGRAKDEKAKPEEPPVVTRHELKVGGKAAEVHRDHRLHAPQERGGQDRGAHLLHGLRARPRRRAPAARPLMFSFNGGPGSSSVWLHLGALGPEAREDARRRRPAGAALRAGGQRADLARVHRPRLHRPRGHRLQPRREARAAARSSGACRATSQSVGEFIRLYLTRYERWASPLFLVGESYGTTRAAGLSGLPGRQGHRLQRHRAGLVDPELPDRALHARATTCPTSLFLPTYTATAWYHKQLPGGPAGEAAAATSWPRSSAGPATDYTDALAQGRRA